MDSYWHKLAMELPSGIDTHPWMQIFMDTTEQIQPQMTEELKANGDFEDYCRVKVGEAVARYQELLDDGYEEQDAKEEVMAYMFPDDEPMTEDWEMEEADEEGATEFMRAMGMEPDEPMDEEDEDDEEDPDAIVEEEDDDAMLDRYLRSRIESNDGNGTA
jgi:hypothetical protein